MKTIITIYNQSYEENRTYGKMEFDKGNVTVSLNFSMEKYASMPWKLYVGSRSGIYFRMNEVPDYYNQIDILKWIIGNHKIIRDRAF